jgi:hypothetical protein
MSERERTSQTVDVSGGESPASPAARQSVAAVTPATVPQALMARRSLERFARWVQWGLLAAGCLAASRDVAALAAAGNLTPGAWLRVLAHGALVLLCYTFAGWGLAAFTRYTIAVVSEHLERAAEIADLLAGERQLGFELLERIARSLEEHGAPGAGPDLSNVPRSRAVAEIERATRGASWSEAERLLAELDTGYPDDPATATLKDQLATARDLARSEQLAELEAAREVNDPDRVLEIYQHLSPALDSERRGSLERDLGKWFLNMIHRRLRSGKVQIDVVQLAGRFAEVFATTPEGASVRASLPTLRRSVGLCPRCAQAYTGAADACLKCLAGPAGGGSNPQSNGEAK